MGSVSSFSSSTSYAGTEPASTLPKSLVKFCRFQIVIVKANPCSERPHLDFSLYFLIPQQVKGVGRVNGKICVKQFLHGIGVKTPLLELNLDLMDLIFSQRFESAHTSSLETTLWGFGVPYVLRFGGFGISAQCEN